MKDNAAHKMLELAAVCTQFYYINLKVIIYIIYASSKWRKKICRLKQPKMKIVLFQIAKW